MKRKMFLVVSVFLLLVVAACSAPQLNPSIYDDDQISTDIQITVVEKTVPPDADSVSLVISNLSDVEYNYGVMYELEKEQDGKWYTVSPKEERIWIAIGIILEPGASNEESATLNEYYGELEAGQYRIVKTFSSVNGNVTAFGVFTVE